MSEEDRAEPGRAGRRHARSAPEDGIPGQTGQPGQTGWPARYGPRPDFTVPPDNAGQPAGEGPPPARPGRHSGPQSVPGWGADPYQNTGLDQGPGFDQNGGPYPGHQSGRRRRPEPPDPLAPPNPLASPAPSTRPAPSAPSGRQAPRSPFTPLTPSAPPVSPAGRPRPGFVPNSDPYPPNGGQHSPSSNPYLPAQDDTTTYGRPVSYNGRRGRDRDADQFSGQDGYAGQDPYADQDGYAGRGDPYGDRDGYTGRRRRGPDGYPAPQDDDPAVGDGYDTGGRTYEFPEAGDYAQHVAGPGRATRATAGREPGPAGQGTPPWDDEDGYEDDDRFVPGLGDSRDAGEYDDDDEYEPGRGGRGGRRSGRGGAGGGKRRKRWLIPLVIILVVLLIPLGVGGFYTYRFVQGRYYPADYATSGTGTAIVQVQTGQTATSVGQRLVTLGVVASVRAFELAAEHSTSNTTLEPGFYRMKKRMKATVAYQLLLTPSARIQDKITIPEGLRLTQIQAQLGAHSGIPLADYQQALSQPASLGLPSYAQGKPEGYLFPATYEVQPNQTAADVLKAMVQRFGQEAASDNLPQAAASVHLTASQVIIMASLIQAEGGSTSYYPQIARVIYNRLAKNMKLQLDSTVMYGLNTFGIIASDQQLRSTSPYNTYKYMGLPPGPIDSPGHAAIEAALHPSSGNDLYFVTTNPKTGLTKFTSSQTQFEQFRQELQQNLGK